MIKKSIHNLFKNRPFLILAVAMIILSLVLSIVIALTIHPSDIQVIVRYTIFGETNFYRDKWTYLLSFIGFIVVTLIIHLTLMIKMLNKKCPLAAGLIGWSFLAILALTFIVSKLVIGVSTVI